jgi:hypothetical protein
MDPCHNGMARPLVGYGDDIQIWGSPANIWDKQSCRGQPTLRWSYSLEVGRGVSNTSPYTGPWNWMLWTEQWTLGFYSQETWLAEWLSASQNGLYCSSIFCETLKMGTVRPSVSFHGVTIRQTSTSNSKLFSYVTPGDPRGHTVWSEGPWTTR